MKLIFILAATFLTACHSGWDKDPFSKDGDRIKNAITPDTKVQKIPPPEQNTLFSSLSPVYSVQEGEELSIFIEYQIAHPEVKLTNIVIKDLAKIFPNSNFDFATKKLSIRPGFDIVASDLDYLTQNLEISFETAYENQTFSVTYKTAILILPVNTEAPVVEKVEALPHPLVVGKSYKFKIQVSDSSAEYSPRVQMLDRLQFNTNVGSQFMKVGQTGTQSPSDPNLWIFDAELTLPLDLQVSGSGKTYTVDVIAYSVSGIPSRADSISFTAYTVATPPTFLTEKTFFIKKDEKFEYLFAVVDDLNRGTVVVKCPNLPTDFNCRCVNSPTIGEPTQCRLNWTPKTTGQFLIDWEAVNTVSQGFGSTVTKAQNTQTLKFTVN